MDAFPHPPLAPNVIEPQAAYDPASRRLTESPLVTANMGLNWEPLPNVVVSPSARYFTEQSAHDNPTDTFVVVRNRFYLDAALMWRQVLGRRASVRLSGTNLLNNRSHVPAQWTRDMYRPQGTAVVLGVDAQF